jgi:hypothetical protein
LNPQKAAPILPPEDINTLFSNIELILNVNREILSNLFADFEDAGDIQLVLFVCVLLHTEVIQMNVGAVFLTMVDYLKIYRSVKFVLHFLHST